MIYNQTQQHKQTQQHHNNKKQRRNNHTNQQKQKNIRAGPVKGGSTVIAFVQDPDGYKIELIQKKQPIPIEL